VVRSDYVVVYFLPASEQKVAVVVSKRFGNAVKRTAYEGYCWKRGRRTMTTCLLVTTLFCPFFTTECGGECLAEQGEGAFP